MHIAIDGPPLTEFDPQPSLNHWAAACHHRPNNRKPERQLEVDIDTDSDVSCLDSDLDIECNSNSD